jgi:precorrin-2 dehydrogenase/sirohydrochlorin ferrochelatase
MFCVSLQGFALKFAIVGRGGPALRRLRLLDAAGAEDVRVFAPEPEPDLAAAAGPHLVPRLPTPDEIAGLHIVLSAGLTAAEAARIASIARAHGTLINTEDDKALCDFHVPATVRRGDLLFSVSTGGGAPRLAHRLRRDLEVRYGPEWAARLDRLAAAREVWRAEGADTEELARRSDALIDGEGWLT